MIKVKMLINTIRSIVFWAIFLLSVIMIPLFIPFLFLWITEEEGERVYQRAVCYCAKLALFLSGVKVDLSGLENIPAEGGVIIAANHSSFIDNIVLMAKLPVLFKFTAYRAGFKLPFIGRIFKGAGYIGAGFKGEEMIAQSLRLIRILKRGERVVMYSLPKRSSEIGTFQNVVTSLSNKLEIKILPVAIKNASKVMPLLRPVIMSNHIKVMVDKPRYFSGAAELNAHFEELYASF